MEKQIVIRTGKYRIHGTLNYSKRTEKLIIFVHGLAGHQNEHIFYNAAQFFPKRGFATFRFDLYSWLPKTRKFKDTTAALQMHDIKEVIHYWKQKYKAIFLVGHSFAGPTILLIDPLVTGMVLWDPSCKLRYQANTWFHYDKKRRIYTIDDNTQPITNKQFYLDIASFPDELKLIQKVHVPIKIIAAGKSELVTGAKKYFQHANKPKSVAIISHATHCFDEEGTETKLFAETLQWMKKYN